jgi:hypothetical protein
MRCSRNSNVGSERAAGASTTSSPTAAGPASRGDVVLSCVEAIRTTRGSASLLLLLLQEVEVEVAAAASVVAVVVVANWS